MKLGDTFRMATAPNLKVRHLYFVISDPALHGGTFVAVNITSDSFRAGTDCILRVGDHPWITGDSFVTFRDAELITPAIEAGLIAKIGKEIFLEAPADEVVLKRIVEAGKTTKSLAQVYKKYL